MGEKVFTRDTATTRVSASLLHGLTPDPPRVVSAASTNSSNSLTSVSALSSNSDTSDTSGKSRTRPQGGGVSVAEDNDYDETPTPVGSPRLSDEKVDAGQGRSVYKRGGMIDVTSSTSNNTFTFPPVPHSNQQHHPAPSVSSKKFVTLKSTSADIDTPPLPTVTPLPTTSSNTPFSFPNSGSTNETSNASTVLVNGGPPPHKHQHQETTPLPAHHRNTFEGIDFELHELTSSQQELAIKHREIVAERKKEQEREKKDKQRLDEILKMCEDYQQDELSGAPHAGAALGFPSQAGKSSNNSSRRGAPQGVVSQQGGVSKKSQPPAVLDVTREPPGESLVVSLPILCSSHWRIALLLFVLRV